MIRLFYILLSILLTAPAAAQKNKNAYCTIHLVISDNSLLNKTITLKSLNYNTVQWEVTDSVVATKNRAVIKTKAEKHPTMALLSVDGKGLVSLIPEAGDILVELKPDEITIGGTPCNDKFQQFMSQQNGYRKQFEELDAHYNALQQQGIVFDDSIAALEKRFQAINQQGSSHQIETMRANIQNALGEFLFIAAMPHLPNEMTGELFAKLRPEVQNLPVMQQVKYKLNADNAAAVGSQYTDLSLLSPEGKKLSISQFAGKGNYVLIDFWASWCGPCIKDLPNVKAAYDKFKEKGFQIVALSFDNAHDKWVQAIERYELSWINMSDLKGWESLAALVYGIRSIPANLLLDGDGKIIAKNLQGSQLTELLADLYGENAQTQKLENAKPETTE